MMDVNSFLRRFLYRTPDPNNDNIFGWDENLRKERRNIAEFEDNFHRIDEQMHMFNEMLDMFHSRFFSPFGSKFEFPNIDECQPCQKSPRSMMLKDSEDDQCDESAFCKENLRRDLIPFLEKGEKPGFFSFSRFSSVKTVQLPDGIIEEQRTVVDSDGKKVTSIRRTIGDTTHEVITKSDVQGMKEKEENFLNMDESGLNIFDQEWNRLRSGEPFKLPRPPSPPSRPPSPPGPPSPPKPPERETPVSVGIPESSPSYWYLIKKYFCGPDADDIKWC